MAKRRVSLTHRKQRPVLTDMLPFEVPPTFSNRGYYRFLRSNSIEIEKGQLRWICETTDLDRIMRLLFGIDSKAKITTEVVTEWGKQKTRRSVPINKCKMATIPFNFRVAHNLDGRILSVKMGEVGNQVLDDLQMRQRIDFHVTAYVLDALGACQRVCPVDVHRAGPTHAFAAGPTKCQRLVDLVFDVDESIEHHWPAGGSINLVGVDPRILVIVWAPAIDAKAFDLGRACLSPEGVAGGHG